MFWLLLNSCIVTPPSHVNRKRNPKPSEGCGWTSVHQTVAFVTFTSAHFALRAPTSDFISRKNKQTKGYKYGHRPHKGRLIGPRLHGGDITEHISPHSCVCYVNRRIIKMFHCHNEVFMKLDVNIRTFINVAQRLIGSFSSRRHFHFPPQSAVPAEDTAVPAHIRTDFRTSVTAFLD